MLSIGLATIQWMEYVGKTCCSYMKFIQNNGKSVLIIRPCRNLAKASNGITLTMLDSDLSSE